MLSFKLNEVEDYHLIIYEHLKIKKRTYTASSENRIMLRKFIESSFLSIRKKKINS